MRVTELAEELRVSPEDLLALLRAMGIPVTGQDAPVREADVARVLARVERGRRAGKKDAADAIQSAIEESRGPSRKRRRRKAADVVFEEPEPVKTEDKEESPELEETSKVGDAIAVHPVIEDPEVSPEADVKLVPPVDGQTVEAVQDLKEVALTAGAEVGVDAGSAGPEERGGDVAVGSKLKRRLRMPEAGLPSAAGLDRPWPRPSTSWKLSDLKASTPRPTPAASAGPGGQVRIQSDDVASDGRRQVRKKGKKRQRVDQDAVQGNIQRVLAELKGGGKKRRRKSSSGPTREEREAREEEERQLAEEEAKTVRVNEFLTVAELSELIDIPSTELVSAAFKNLGLMVTINQRLDFDQLELLLDEFNVKAVREEEYSSAEEEAEEAEEDPSSLLPRPPVVTVMGHVDHGKTLLLDSIRKTNVVAGESGGITQHIGAYHVEIDDGHTITFLDTPGHAAFTAMRARGADVTDIVVLVVAADDSIMPQTIEAISHAKNAGAPLVVAINKIDLPAANPTKVKQELLQQGVTPEEFGGDVLVAEASAKSGQGVDDVLEKILLQAEILELRANPNREAQGVVIEARLDVGKGPVVTVLVQKGTLRVGNALVCGKFEGRVRAMMDERGNSVKEATPGLPVQLLGIAGVPQAGDKLAVMEAVQAGEIAQRRRRLEREKQLRIKERGVKLGDLAHFMKEGEVVTLFVVVKADADGSVQAVSDSLEQLSTSEVKVEIVHRAVGAINESDVLLAETAGAIIIGFRVRPDTNSRLLAERNGIEVHLYDVIYEAVDDITKAMEGMLSPEKRENIIGVAEVREIFKMSKIGTIAGCYVENGIIDRKGKARLMRGGRAVYDGEVESLKRFKDDVKEVREGFECGIGIVNFNDIKVGDTIECYLVEEIARTLAGSSAGQGR